MMVEIGKYLVCILALLVLCYETWLVIKRNRTVFLPGKDDFFSLCLVMLFAMLLLQPNETSDFLEALCSTLVLMAIFFSMAVKRGLSEAGVVKLGFIIPWDRILEIRVLSYQTAKLMVQFSTRKHVFKLFYPRHQLKNLVYELQQHKEHVMIEESLKLN